MVKKIATSRRAVLVVGMHRAGTSAMARVLSLRGATLPEHVMPPNYGNATGYWEPERVVELNDRMLEYFGVEWNDPFAAYQLPPVEAIPTRFVAEAIQILEQEYAGSELFVLKDPRCTLLHEFWRHVLTVADIRLCPVVVMRPFEEVAESLIRRDGTSAVGAALLYIAYGLEAAKVAESGATATTYQQLLADWRATTDRIASDQKFSWPISGARMAREVEAFLQPSKPVAPHPLRLPGTLADWATQVWNWFDAAAHGKPRPASALDGIRGELEAAMAVFAPLLADRARQVRELSAATDEALQKALQAAERFDESQSTLARTAAERDTALAERDIALTQHRDIEVRLRLAGESHVRAGDLEGLLRQTADERDTVLRQHQQTEARLHDTEAAYRRLESERDAALAERDQAMQQQQQTEAELRQTQSAFQTRQREFEGLQALLDGRERQRLEAAAALSRVQQQAVQAQARSLELETGFRRQHEELAQKLLQAQHQAKAEADELGAALRQATTERDHALQCYRQTEEELERTQTSYRHLEETSQEALRAAHAQLTQLQGRADGLEQALSELTKQDATLRTSLALARSGLAAAREELADAGASIAHLGE